jgi:probable HAF family extracellular repeat protein
MSRQSIWWRVASLLLVIVAVRPVHTGSIRYNIQEIPTLGGSQNFAYAINDRGDVVGSSWLSGDSSSAAFLYSLGTLTSLSPLNDGAFQTVGPTGINNLGQIASGLISNGLYTAALYDSQTNQIAILGSLGGVCCGMFSSVAVAVNGNGAAAGYSYVDSVNRHAFLHKDGTMTDLGSFGGWSVAYDINEGAEVVGAASDQVNGFAHAFVYRDGVMTEIDPFGGPNNESYANGINDNGKVVGTGLVATGNAFNAFIYSNGVIGSIGTLPGGLNSEAFSINNRDQVVGIADKPYRSRCIDDVSGKRFPCTKYEQKAFLYQNNEMIDLNSLIPPNSGWDLDWAFDINVRGQIVGYGVKGGVYRAYLMTPKP